MIRVYPEAPRDGPLRALFCRANIQHHYRFLPFQLIPQDLHVHLLFLHLGPHWNLRDLQPYAMERIHAPQRPNSLVAATEETPASPCGDARCRLESDSLGPLSRSTIRVFRGGVQ